MSGTLARQAALWQHQRHHQAAGHGSCSGRGPAGKPGRCSRRQAVAEWTSVLSTKDDETWDEKYGEEGGALSYGSAAQQGPRDSMEDYVAIVPKGRCGYLYAGVFDGHSGAASADWLVHHLYDAFSQQIDDNALQDAGPGQSAGLACPIQLSGLLSDIFTRLDRELLQWLQEHPDEDERMSGSTATMLLARRDRVVVANVGDSRAVLCRGGKPIALSAEHRLSEKTDTGKAEIERVRAAGGWVEDERVCDILAVSRAFGDPDFKGPGRQRLLHKGVESEFWDQAFADSVHWSSDPVVALPDVCELDATEADEFVVLASDGLWDVLSNEEMIKTCKRHFQLGRDAQFVADHLTRVAIQRGTQDNVSCAVIDLGGGVGGWQKPKREKVFGLF